jgi:hypothetical protein
MAADIWLVTVKTQPLSASLLLLGRRQTPELAHWLGPLGRGLIRCCLHGALLLLRRPWRPLWSPHTPSWRGNCRDSILEGPRQIHGGLEILGRKHLHLLPDVVWTIE